MKMSSDGTRRALLVSTATAAGWLAATACGGAPPPVRAAPQAKREEAEEVSANEDLMREHGVLDRLLLVYEAAIAEGGKEPNAVASVHRAAGLVSTFIEQYHEKLEEDFIFPLLERAQRHGDVIRTLRAQHTAGRELTQAILRFTAPGSAADPDHLSRALRAFVRMYRPHAAREDTVIFPALHAIVGSDELEALGERFEEVEHERFGEDGFDSVVRQVEEIERALGIYELSQFTPGPGGAP